MACSRISVWMPCVYKRRRTTILKRKRRSRRSWCGIGRAQAASWLLVACSRRDSRPPGLGTPAATGLCRRHRRKRPHESAARGAREPRYVTACRTKRGGGRRGRTRPPRTGNAKEGVEDVHIVARPIGNPAGFSVLHTASPHPTLHTVFRRGQGRGGAHARAGGPWRGVCGPGS